MISSRWRTHQCQLWKNLLSIHENLHTKLLSSRLNPENVSSNSFELTTLQILATTAFVQFPYMRFTFGVMQNISEISRQIYSKITALGTYMYVPRTANCRIKFNTYLKNSILSPSKATLNILVKPPAITTPIQKTVTIEPRVTINCRVSVQTTAFKPPIVV